MRTIHFKESELQEILSKLETYNNNHRLTKHSNVYWVAYDKIRNALYNYEIKT